MDHLPGGFSGSGGGPGEGSSKQNPRNKNEEIIVKWQSKQNVHDKTSGEDSDIITYAISNSLTYMSKNISQRTEVIVMVFDYPERRGVDDVHNHYGELHLNIPPEKGRDHSRHDLKS